METGASKNCWLPIVLALAVASTVVAQGAEPAVGQYSVAAYASDGVDVNSRLVVFPSDGKESSIPLPLTLQYVAYAASGKSVYATAFTKNPDAKSFSTLPGLFKIELNPVRVSAVPGVGMVIDRFAVSRKEDRILFGASRSDAGRNVCGVYELDLSDGNLRSVLETTDCRAGFPWRVYDLSPNTPEALISANRRLATLDLANGKVTPLGSELSTGSYSPDGKWIAAIELHNPRPPTTILIDRQDLSRRRDLGGTDDAEVVWSPDSRLLLHAAYRPACPSQNALALETLDIQTGKRLTLKNSICNTGSSRAIGWVDSKIGR